MSFDFELSSGAFRLPTAAQSVDWLVLNNTDSEQHVRVTVFVASGGQGKYEIPPASREVDLPPRTLAHHASHVGSGNSFDPGMPIEVVVECNDLRVLPTVEVWEDHGAKIMPGTRIGPRDFIRIDGT